MLQMPLYEALRGALAAARRRARRADAARGALAGGAAGAFAAAHTTPLDVVRTRPCSRAGRLVALLADGAEDCRRYGVQGLFRGILPRTAYSLGGVVYLGSYSYVTDLVTRVVA